MKYVSNFGAFNVFALMYLYDVELHLQVNSFSCALASNGSWTFALFHYPSEGISWTAADDHGGTKGQ